MCACVSVRLKFRVVWPFSHEIWYQRGAAEDSNALQAAITTGVCIFGRLEQQQGHWPRALRP